MESYIQLSKKPEIYLINFPQKTGKVYFDYISEAGKIFELGHGLKGAGHIFEHYVIGKIKKDPDFKVLDINGVNSYDYVRFYIESERENFLSDLGKTLSGIYDSNFSDCDLLKKEFLSIKNEIYEKKNNLENQNYDKILSEIFFGKCLYPGTIVNRKDLDNGINYKIIESFHKQFLSIEPVFFIGGYELQDEFLNKTKKIIKQYYLKFKVNFKKVEFQKNFLRSYCVDEIKNPYIQNGIYSFLIFPGLFIEKNNVRDRIGLNILRKIVCDDPDFGIFYKVRQKGIFSIGFENIMERGIAFLGLRFFSEEKQFVDVFEIIKEHLLEIKSGKIAQKNIDRVVEDINMHQKEIWNNNSKRYSWIADDIMNMGFVADLEYCSRIISEISPEFLRKIANQVFDFNKLNILLIYGEKGSLSKKERKKIDEIFSDCV